MKTDLYYRSKNPIKINSKLIISLCWNSVVLNTAWNEWALEILLNGIYKLQCSSSFLKNIKLNFPFFIMIISILVKKICPNGSSKLGEEMIKVLGN